jgi:uncharacterized protein (DUF488 family)
MAGLRPILTIGHSRHSLERFIASLEGAGATAVADVRSAPVSRFSPHFNKAALAASLAARSIDYIFLGKELGGRPARPELYSEGVADYGKMAASPEFKAGIARLIEASQQHRVAAMCSEADPLDCHRCLFVARALAQDGIEIGHVLASGATCRIERRRIGCCNSPVSPRRACCSPRAMRGWPKLIAPAPAKPPMPFHEKLRGDRSAFA